MSFAVRRFRPEDRPSIERLNERLEEAGFAHRLYPESPAEQAVNAHSARPRFTRLLVAAEDGEVRGGVWLTSQDLRLMGETTRAGWIKYPVAESLIDPAYSGIPGALVFQMMREEPIILSLGLGGHDTPFARLLAGLKWVGSTIPFYFQIVNPFTVLRQMRFLRNTRWRTAVMEALAWSGAGWVGHRMWRSVQRLRLPTPPTGYGAAIVDEFGPWADRLWERWRDAYSVASTRDADSLNDLYPDDFEGLARIRVTRAGADVGWACTTLMDLSRGTGHRHFGRMRVGLVADCFGPPEEAPAVMAAATRHLIGSGADLLVSNQGHPAWGRALHDQGYLHGPSNFACYRPPAVDRLIAQGSAAGLSWHLTRGDGDGPRWS